MKFQIFCLIVGLLATGSNCVQFDVIPENNDPTNDGEAIHFSSMNQELNLYRPSPYALSPGDEATLMADWRCKTNDTTSAVDMLRGYRRFPTSVVTYKVLKYTPDMADCDVRNTLKKAFRVWEEVAEITFRPALDDEVPDMEIMFAYGKHADCPDFALKTEVLAHASRNYIHFDDFELWSHGKGRTFTNTHGGYGNGAPCSFPFIHNRKSYNSCIPWDEHIPDGRKWCCTTPDCDHENLYGYCETAHVVTFGGTGNGDPCSFPFLYNNQLHYECTDMATEGQAEQLWCGTSYNYDQEKLWGFCPRPMNQSLVYHEDCVFPFIYKDVTYNECTRMDSKLGKLWCSKTHIYNSDERFAYCEDDEGIDLFSVAVHEIGHTLGLNHSSNCLSVLYPSYILTENLALHDVDTAAARTYYGPRMTALAPLEFEYCPMDYNNRDRANPATTMPPTTTRRTRKPQLPRQWKEICDLESVDALLYISQVIFIFKGTQLWTWYPHTGQVDGPYAITKAFHSGPESVDAAYVTPDKEFVFFKDQQYWKFDRQYRKMTGPAPLTNLGFGEDVLKVDAAINWRRDSKQRWTTFFVGEDFYSYDETHKVELMRGNPNKVTLWDPSNGAITSATADPVYKKWSVLFRDDSVIRVHSKTSQIRETSLTKFLRCGKRP